MKTCGTCDGQGEIEVWSREGAYEMLTHHGPRISLEACPECYGRGIVLNPCSDCENDLAEGQTLCPACEKLREEEEG